MNHLQDLDQGQYANEPTTKNDLGVDCIVDVLGSYTDLDIPYKREIAENILTKLHLATPQEPKWLKSELIKLIDKTYEDFNNAPGGEGWCKIDGKEYYSDMGYAFEGINMFVDVLKSRMEDT